MFYVKHFERVRRLRRARGWLQKDLAHAAGIDLAVVSMIETGRRLPTLKSSVALAVTLQRSLEFLLFGLRERGMFFHRSRGPGNSGGAA